MNGYLIGCISRVSLFTFIFFRFSPFLPIFTTSCLIAEGLKSTHVLHVSWSCFYLQLGRFCKYKTRAVLFLSSCEFLMVVTHKMNRKLTDICKQSHVKNLSGIRKRVFCSPQGILENNNKSLYNNNLYLCVAPYFVLMSDSSGILKNRSGISVDVK